MQLGWPFRNECKLKYTACSSGLEIEVAREGPCNYFPVFEAVEAEEDEEAEEDCLEICTNEYRTVCGTDGVTYLNRYVAHCIHDMHHLPFLRLVQMDRGPQMPDTEKSLRNFTFSDATWNARGV